jgi:hypothetical protein
MEPIDMESQFTWNLLWLRIILSVEQLSRRRRFDQWMEHARLLEVEGLSKS